MSTSLLYHGFGIVGYKYVRTDYREGDVIFTVSRKKFSLRCSVCKSKKVYSTDLFLDGFIVCLSAGNRHTLKQRYPDWNVKNAMSSANQILGLQTPVSRIPRPWRGMFSIWPGI